METLWTKLESFYQALEGKLSPDAYFEICDQLGQDIDLDKIPTDWTDLPETAQVAINIYNKLGDRVVPDIGFLGKDYTLLTTLLNTHSIDNLEVTTDIILWLEARAIKKSSEALKKERDKIKKKSRVGKSVRGHL